MSRIKVTHYKIKVKDPKNQPSQPFSVAVLADLHNASLGEGNKELLHEIRKAAPRLVLSAGDLVVAKAGRSAVGEAVKLLGELTRQYPVCCVNGNHESRMGADQERYPGVYEEYLQQIRSLGVTVLQNESCKMEICGMKLRIYGYELDGKYYKHGPLPKMQPEELTQKLGDPREDEYTILLAHHPAYFSAYASWGADLTLAGHLHGGMVRLPVLGGVISPGWILFPKYDKGFYRIEEKKMAVSAGLASHTIKLRINNPPELVIVDFV